MASSNTPTGSSLSYNSTSDNTVGLFSLDYLRATGENVLAAGANAVGALARGDLQGVKDAYQTGVSTQQNLSNLPIKSSTNAMDAATADGAKLVRDSTFNVVADYPWTLNTNLRKQAAGSLKEVPYIRLTEYEIDESIIQSQFDYYANKLAQIVVDDKDLLAPYKELFPGRATNNVYYLPYFSEKNFEVNSPQWISLDTLEQGQKMASGIVTLLNGREAGELFDKLATAAGQTATTIAGASYPKIGIMDRPKLWQSHDYRTIEIKFPLFNTVNPDDWIKNHALCWVLVNQNLFYKKNFIVGMPPVFYKVLIPGQHYSTAACVTNISIYNRGNMRTLINDGVETIVPDAYEVSITLTDMVMPSRNLFRSIQSVSKKVTTDVSSEVTTAESTTNISTWNK